MSSPAPSPSHGWWVLPGAPIICPRSVALGAIHHVRPRNAHLGEHGAIWCTYRPHAHHAPCGELLYVLQFPRGLRFITPITYPQLREMEECGMSVTDVLEYLGATVPPRHAAGGA